MNVVENGREMSKNCILAFFPFELFMYLSKSLETSLNNSSEAITKLKKHSDTMGQK